MSKRKIAIIVVLDLVVTAIIAFLVFFHQPLLDRIWDADVSVLAQVDIEQDTFTIDNARDWTYQTETVVEENYFSQEYRFDDIEGATFYIQPLDLSGLVAHTFVVFHFPEDSYAPYHNLGISVETRREQGEQYSIVGGMFNKYELMHTWATERDLVNRRTVYYDYQVIPHRINSDNVALAAILREFLTQTDQLSREPRFYNTALHNCTNTLAYYINAVYPDAIPWHISYIFTGLSDSYLESLGYITKSGSQ